MASVEKSLSFKPIPMEAFKLMPPLKLPKAETIQRELNALADCVFGECGDRIKSLVQ